MPHIHDEPGQHDHTASAFIVRTDLPEPAVILHEHRKIGRILQFGGHIELDETPWEALLREIREESGYAPEQLSILQPPSRFTGQFPGVQMHPIPFCFNTHRFLPGVEHFHSDQSYAVLASSAPKHSIGEGESTGIRAYTAAEVRSLPPDRIFHLTRANAIFILEQLLHQWEPVPATEWPT